MLKDDDHLERISDHLFDIKTLLATNNLIDAAFCLGKVSNFVDSLIAMNIKEEKSC